MDSVDAVEFADRHTVIASGSRLARPAAALSG